MLFSEPAFLFAFLPITLVGFYLLVRFTAPAWAILWLVLASLFFYGWWRPAFVFLLLSSAAFNYVVGLVLARYRTRLLLVFGIAGNLGLLGVFKYLGFFTEIVNDLTNLGVPVPHIILPLGISFYTFQQIAYLADIYAEDKHEPNLARYLLFVTFFPQLVAGPIVHHREMLPQFERSETFRLVASNLVLGLTAFGLGLFKKVCLADPLAGITPLAFGPAADGLAPQFVDAWLGSLAYALQIYFDFSGYSDMAIGLGLMFGIRLPVNFSSPYRAASIIEFWSRWHMTLTRFLTAYIYNPISITVTRRRMAAGKPLFNRNRPRLEPFLMLVAMPTVITMTLAGIWHGAGWTFLVFGVWHGLLLAVNHGWRAARRTYGWNGGLGPFGRPLSVILTFVCVIVGLVFFKSETISQALTVLQAMAGFGGEVELVAQRFGPQWNEMTGLQIALMRLVSVQGALITVGLLIVYLLPNTPQYVETISGRVKQTLGEARAVMRWPLIRHIREGLLLPRPSFVQGSAIGVLLALALLRAASVAPTEFLYFTF